MGFGLAKTSASAVERTYFLVTHATSVSCVAVALVGCADVWNVEIRIELIGVMEGIDFTFA